MRKLRTAWRSLRGHTARVQMREPLQTPVSGTSAAAGESTVSRSDQRIAGPSVHIPYEILVVIFESLSVWGWSGAPFPNSVAQARGRRALVNAALVDQLWFAAAYQLLSQDVYVTLPGLTQQKKDDCGQEQVGTVQEPERVRSLWLCISALEGRSNAQLITAILEGFANLRYLDIELRISMSSPLNDQPQESEVARACCHAISRLSRLRALSIQAVFHRRSVFGLYPQTVGALSDVIPRHFAGHLRICPALFGNGFLSIHSLTSSRCHLSPTNLAGLFLNGVFIKLDSLCLRNTHHAKVPLWLLPTTCPNLREIWFGDVSKSTGLQDPFIDKLTGVGALGKLEKLACPFKPEVQSGELHLPPSLRHFHILDPNECTVKHLLDADLPQETLVIYDNRVVQTCLEGYQQQAVELGTLMLCCEREDIRYWYGTAAQAFPWVDCALGQDDHGQDCSEQLFSAAYDLFRRGAVPSRRRQ